MKPILVSILLMLVLTQTFSRWFVLIEYELNKEFIAKNLCINKSKPQLHCNGKCQMMKKLAEDEKQNAPANTNTKIKVQEVSCTDTLPEIGIKAFEEGSLHHYSCYLIAKYASPFSSIFHPPAQV